MSRDDRKFYHLRAFDQIYVRPNHSGGRPIYLVRDSEGALLCAVANEAQALFLARLEGLDLARVH